MFISEELLLQGAAAIGLTPDADAVRRFDAYARLLAEYNEKVNLTAITDPDGIVMKHFTDSLYLTKFAPLTAGLRVCDVGTGAGFPGVCLLIARPDLRLTLFDSIRKKLDFLRFLLRELDLEAEIVVSRAEDAGRDPAFREMFDLATARAVAELNRLSEYCVPLVRVGGTFAPMKAPLTEEEAQRGIGAAANLGAKLVRRERYCLPEGSGREILLFEKISPTPPKYPRNPAQIAKKPL